jgi:hypothetical protein
VLIIERPRRDAKAIPPVVRIGVVALVMSGLADIVLHAITPAVAGAADGHTSAELAAHFAGFVSMVVIFLGVVTDGARKTSHRRTASRRESKGAS